MSAVFVIMSLDRSRRLYLLMFMAIRVVVIPAITMMLRPPAPGLCEIPPENPGKSLHATAFSSLNPKR